LHYVLWQRAVLREARRQHRRHKFDLVHHLSWGTISAPPLLWRLPIPLVWGPVGGAQTAPPAYRRYFGSAWRREFLRTFRLKLVTRMPRLRRTVRACALILSTNPETTQALKAAGARAVRFFPNIGVPDNLLSRSPDQQRPDKSEFVILWAGRLIPIKGLALSLEALAQLDGKLPVRLRVVGDGPLRADMEKLAHTLGIAERVEFVGAVPWSQMKRYYREADIFLFTSLRDSSGAVLAEALASRLPIVTLNHQGAGAIVPTEAAIKVAVTDPDETVRNLSKAMQLLITSPELRRQMAEAAASHAQSLSWTRHAEKMTGWYEEILADALVNTEYAYAAV
jgi:glycosyltransferase involved in cell wall biosynthesis